MVKLSLKNLIIILSSIAVIIFGIIKWKNEAVNNAVLIERSEQEGKIKVWKDILILKEQEALYLKQIVDESLVNTKVDTSKIHIKRNEKINIIRTLNTDESIQLFAKYLHSRE